MEKVHESIKIPGEQPRRSSAWKIAVVTDKEATLTVVFPLAEEPVVQDERQESKE